MSEIRAAAALVAHVLHTPVTALEDATVDSLVDWADDAREVLVAARRAMRGSS